MNELQIIEHKQVRVLTTQQLAEVYETTVDNIKQNFKRNKERFIEGRDYYLLKGEELKDFLQVTNSHLQISNMTRSMYLWTERGANRHSKILDTDKAWQQFDVLEETYFKVKTQQKQLSQIEIMRIQLGMIDDHEERLKSLENNMTITSSQQHTLNNIAKETVIKCLGGKDSQAYKKLSKVVFSTIWRDYKNYFKIPSYRDTLQSDYDTALAYLRKWRPDMNLAMNIDCENHQIQFDII